MKIQSLLLAFVVVTSLLFGNVLHAFIPHDHEGSEALWQELHASLRHDNKAAFVSSALSILIVPLIFAAAVRPAYALAPRGRRERLLEKGIEKYRRFG